jgi:hypothetical protein
MRVLAAYVLVLAACGFSSENDGDGPLGGALRVRGDVVDFETGATITTTASVNTSGLSPAPQVTTRGASYEIDGIPENSAFQLLASSPPTHRATFSDTIIVTDEDLASVDVPAVSEALLERLATAFGVTPTAAKGVLFVKLVDANGDPKANVVGTNLLVANAVGPKFLGADFAPLPAATASSTAGWTVFFEVPTGVVVLGAPVSSTVSVEMPTSPINAGTVTIASAVIGGELVLPTNVSFQTQVFPIFSARGCVACHSGGGIGKNLGGLHLDGSANLAYRELVEERAGVRVNTTTPEASLVLTNPSREEPPDRHPNVTWTGPTDPDYLKILVWIREGARNN